jgi:hypothetical protein
VATVIYKRQLVNRVSDMHGNMPRAFELLRIILTKMNEALVAFSGIFSPSPGSGGGSGSGGPADLATRAQVTWTANGPYPVDTAVDGGWMVPTDMKILSVNLYRDTPGTAGSTVLDINRTIVGSTTPVSLYTTQANRPTIAWNDSDYRVQCNLPDAPNVMAGDVVTVDTDQIESGRPMNWRLTLEGA